MSIEDRLDVYVATDPVIIVKKSDFDALNAELQSLRSQSLSTQQPMGEVRVKALEWEFIDGGRNISFWRAPNPLGGLPFEATSQEQMRQREDRYHALVLSALHPNQESGK